MCLQKKKSIFVKTFGLPLVHNQEAFFYFSPCLFFRKNHVSNKEKTRNFEECLS